MPGTMNESTPAVPFFVIRIPPLQLEATMFIILLACLSNKQSIDTSQSETSEPEDTSIPEPAEELDQDGDGFPSWNGQPEQAIADCNDSDDSITPDVTLWIPEGPFTRGNDQIPAAAPARQIFLSDFCIDRYEVTNQQFADFLDHQRLRGFENSLDDGRALYDFDDSDDPFPATIEQGNGGEYLAVSGYEEHPVTEIWHWAAAGYCSWKGGSLPTEAQWEKSARGPGQQAYPWGEDPPTCVLANYGTIESSCEGSTLPIGSHPEGASPYGLMDVAGNVSEWVQDWYSTSYYSSSPDRDPNGPIEPEGFTDQQGNIQTPVVARSGNHSTGPGNMQVFFRQAEPHDATSNGLGFRCAYRPE